MESWSVHHLIAQAKEKGLNESATALGRYAQHLQSRDLPVIFTLAHLGKITSSPYKFLHETVNRKRDHLNYSMFRIHKRSGGYRFIHAVNGRLLHIQKFINQEILQKIQPHHCSFAFSRCGGIKKCADMHLGCDWLIKFDLRDFFTTITEKDVYKVFHKLGYTRLLSFELARLCTTLRLPEEQKKYLRENRVFVDYNNLTAFPYSSRVKMGVLPQGAPTSPMLSNLVAYELDKALESYAVQSGFVYTRYADDLTFSAVALPEDTSVPQIIHDVYAIIRKHHFTPNTEKTSIKGPGSRRMVLGLLVDGEISRVSKQMRHRVERNLYAIGKYGLAEVAKHEGFESAYGFCNHMNGLLAYIQDVDLKLKKKYEADYVNAMFALKEFQ